MTVAAAVELGSNATRLLVVRDGSELLRRSTITRLADGLTAGGRLGEHGLERTAAAMRDHAAVLRDVGADRVRVIGTAAVRLAANRDLLLTAAEQVFGVTPEVLAAEDEARLAFRGAVAGVELSDRPDAGILVVDVGGASTELAFAASSTNDATADADASPIVASMAIGSALLSADELTTDPPRPEELSNAIAIAHGHLEEALLALPGIDPVDPPLIVGVGGTVTTMAAVEVGVRPDVEDGAGPAPSADVLDPRLHRFHLSRAAAEDVFRTLAREPLADRIHNPGLPRDRAGVIVGGCCLVVTVLRRLKATGLTVSVHDALDAVVAELAAP